MLYFTLTEQCLVLDVYTVVLEGKALREHRRAPVGPGLEAWRPHDAAIGQTAPALLVSRLEETTAKFQEVDVDAYSR